MCGCNQDGATGNVLKLINGVWGCVPHAVFLPNNNVGSGDAPSIEPTTPGIWYDLLPKRACDSQQECWDMCFFCDGRPKYHPNYLAAKQLAGRKTVTQQQGSCKSTSTCDLQAAIEESTDQYYEACRRWSVEINHFGNQLGSLRTLYNNAAETNSFHTTKSGARIWPYRPRRTNTNNNIIMYGLQSQAAAKCSDCFTNAKAEIIDKVLVRYGG